MNQQWEESRGGEGGGSVRKARQRAEAGEPHNMSSPPRQKQYDQYRPSPSGGRARPQAPAGFSGTRDAQGQIGVAISRPTKVPQWPLAGSLEGGQYQPPANRGPAPQRPPRPSNVPSMLDASRLQDPTPTFQYTPAQNLNQHTGGNYYEENDVLSPTSPDFLSPGTGSSRPSTVSSVGSIPEFPVPAIPQTLPLQGPRRSGNLGPPPLSRRGASSYYSQASFVSPIPEESPRSARFAPSHLSYASSAAIPSSNWSPNPDSPVSPGFLYDDYYAHGTTEDGRTSRGSTADDSDDRGLIRSASMGKRAKPSMIMTKSSEKVDAERPITQMPNPLQVQKLKAEDSKKAAGSMPSDLSPPNAAFTGQRQTFWPSVGNPDSPLASGTGLMDPTPTTSAESVPTLKQYDDAAKGHAPSNSKSKAAAILGASVAARGLSPGPTQSRTPSPGGFNRFSAMRRPPRLDIDAVRDAEARGSLTSLPDLIRRATKLASMMDRGRRPGSRMNDLSDFPTDIDLSSRNNRDLAPGNVNARMSNMSGMLASFPPPGNDTPRSSLHRPQSQWPTGFGSSGAEKKDRNGQKQPRKSGRRCCGMPCWLALLLNFILLLVVAAAVVIPVYFLVIKKNNTPAALTALQKCQQDTATSCQNGGVASLSTGSCSCLCINGFTGPTCTTFNEGACAATSFALSEQGGNGTVQVANATLGDAITRLITGSQANFSIPLDESIILSRFNAGGLSCVSQNALVTFEGQSRRIGAANAVILPTGTTTTRSRRNQRRQASTTTTANSAVGTASGGIIFDTGAAAPDAEDSASPTTSITATEIVEVGALFNITQEVLDFSRVAVLYILQEETLDSAVVAQSNLQKFFGVQSYTNGAAKNVSVGNGNSIDLLAWRLEMGKGSIGGKGSATIAGKREVLNLW